MKKILKTLILFLLPILVFSQNTLEVEGKAKITVMDTENTADSVVVRLADGTLAIREVATLSSASPWYHGKDTLGGIVFYIYKGSDGQDHGLIVDTIETTAKWQNTGVLDTADRSWDGAYNTSKMTDSPAKDSVDARSAILPGDWYLPSIDELSLLWHNRFHANKALSDGGHTLLSTTAHYWSSTESSASIAWVFTFYFGYANANLVKTGTRSVRAIRAF